MLWKNEIYGRKQQVIYLKSPSLRFQLLFCRFEPLVSLCIAMAFFVPSKGYIKQSICPSPGSRPEYSPHLLAKYYITLPRETSKRDGFNHLHSSLQGPSPILRMTASGSYNPALHAYKSNPQYCLSLSLISLNFAPLFLPLRLQNINCHISSML